MKTMVDVLVEQVSDAKAPAADRLLCIAIRRSAPGRSWWSATCGLLPAVLRKPIVVRPSCIQQPRAKAIWARHSVAINRGDSLAPKRLQTSAATMGRAFAICVAALWCWAANSSFQ